MKKKFFILTGAVLIIILLVSMLIFSNFPEKESFNVNTILLKVNVPLGGEFSTNIKITNNEKLPQDFNIYFNNLRGFVSVDKDKLSLSSKKSENIKVSFSGSESSEDVHVGQLIIETPNYIKKIPIILNVADKEGVFVITQTPIPRYESPQPGGKFGVEIKTFDIGKNTPKNINIKYTIKNFDDESIFIEEEDALVKESLVLTKIVQLPDTFSYGDYVFVTTITYNGIKTSTAQLFSVSNLKTESSGSGFQWFWVFAMVIVIFILAIIGFLFYFIKTRDQVLLSLEKQQKEELKRNISLVDVYKKEVKKLKNKKERKIKIKKAEEIKKKIIKKIKKEHGEQRREVKKLKKAGKSAELFKKIKYWENKGYKMYDAEKEIKRISNNQMKKQINNWRKQGYKTDFLSK